MNAVYKRSHLGAILLVAGLVILIATIGLGGYMMVRGASKVFATVENAGTHTFAVPAAGEYVFVCDGEMQPHSPEITVTPTDDNITFEADTQTRMIVIGERHYLILGTLTVPEAGEFTAEISAKAYPITLRHEPMAVTRKIVLIFGSLAVIPLAMTVIGIVITIRNANKRNRFIMEQMI